MPNPGLGDWSSRGETCFGSYGALVERADRDRRVDRVAPNESSVAQLRAELWPETCFGPEVFFIILPPFINQDRTPGERLAPMDPP